MSSNNQGVHPEPRRREKQDAQQNHLQKPLQVSSPIYLHTRKMHQFTPPRQSIQHQTRKDSYTMYNFGYNGRQDPPEDIQLAEHHDYSSVTDSCVTGSKSVIVSDPGTPDSNKSYGSKQDFGHMLTGNNNYPLGSGSYDPFINKIPQKKSSILRENALSPVFSDDNNDSDSIYDGDQSTSGSNNHNVLFSKASHRRPTSQISAKSKLTHVVNPNVTKNTAMEKDRLSSHFISDSSEDDVELEHYYNNSAYDNKYKNDEKHSGSCYDIETPFDEAKDESSLSSEFEPKISKPIMKLFKNADFEPGILSIQNENTIQEDENKVATSPHLMSKSKNVSNSNSTHDKTENGKFKKYDKAYKHSPSNSLNVMTDEDSNSSAKSSHTEELLLPPSTYIPSLLEPNKTRISSEDNLNVSTNAGVPTTYQSFATLSKQEHHIHTGDAQLIREMHSVSDDNQNNFISLLPRLSLETNDHQIPESPDGNKFSSEEMCIEKTCIDLDLPEIEWNVKEDNEHNAQKFAQEKGHETYKFDKSKQAHVGSLSNRKTITNLRSNDSSSGLPTNASRNLQPRHKIETFSRPPGAQSEIPSKVTESRKMGKDISIHLPNKHNDTSAVAISSRIHSAVADESDNDNDSSFQGGVEGHSPGFHPESPKSPPSSNTYSNIEYDTTPPRKKIAQSFSSHLVSKKASTAAIKSPCDDEDSIFVFSEEVEAKVQARNQHVVQNKSGGLVSTKRDKVIFEDNKNSVHHFDTVPANDDYSGSSYSETDDSATYESDYSRETYDTRASYDTMYSKSMQSEVEDAMKDLFFIGRGTHNAPGRRKVKYRSDVREWKKARNRKFKLQEIEDEGSEDEGSEENLSDAEPNKVRKNKTETQLDWMWGYVEDGINAVGEAFGLSDQYRAPTNAKTEKARSAHKNENKLLNSPKKSPKTRTIKNSPITSTNERLRQQSLRNDIPSLPTLSLTDESRLSDNIEKERSSREYIQNKILPIQSQNINAVGLEESALCAAQTYHQQQGLIYDGTTVDSSSDIQFSVIIISLPLGILFQENAAGCWVTRVFRSGNAAKNSTGNGVKVGDQLLAVNGKSTYEMKIDETCAMISSSSNPKEIELTFVRYIGPIRGQTKRSDMTKKKSPETLNQSNNLNSLKFHDSNTIDQRSESKPPPPPPPRDEEIKGSNDHVTTEEEINPLHKSTKLVEKSPTKPTDDIDEIPYMDIIVKEEDLLKEYQHTTATQEESKSSPEGKSKEKKPVETSSSNPVNSSISKEGSAKAKDVGKKKKILNLIGRFKKKK